MKQYLLLMHARTRGPNLPGVVAIRATTSPRAPLAMFLGTGLVDHHLLIPSDAAPDIAQRVQAELQQHNSGIGAMWLNTTMDNLIATTSRLLKQHGGDAPVVVGGIYRGSGERVAA